MSAHELSKVPAEIAADALDTRNGEDVTITTAHNDATSTHLKDGTVTFNASESASGNVDGSWPESMDERVRQLISEAINAREVRENKRANHRNFNRMLTLMGALVIGLIVTYVLSHDGIPGVLTLPAWTHGLAPYAFVITVAMDSLLALYSFIRHY